MDRVEQELRQELGELVEKEKIQCCVLGCTHYSLVSDRIQKLFPNLALVDPAREMARNLERYLRQNDLNREGGEKGRVTIYTTGEVKEYTLRANQVGLERVEQICSYPALEI